MPEREGGLKRYQQVGSKGMNLAFSVSGDDTPLRTALSVGVMAPLIQPADTNSAPTACQALR